MRYTKCPRNINVMQPSMQSIPVPTPIYSDLRDLELAFTLKVNVPINMSKVCYCEG